MVKLSWSVVWETSLQDGRSILEKHSENFTLDPNIHVPFQLPRDPQTKVKDGPRGLFNPDANDPFKQGQQNTNSFNGTSNNNSWGAQPSEPANSWMLPLGKPQQNRVFGSTSGSNGTDPIPF